MNSSPNPLRPYYVPPSLGLSPSETANAASVVHVTATASSRTTIGSAARDLLPDLDYADYLGSSPSPSDWFRDLLDRALWKYLSVLVAQPFDVAKTLLQIYVPDPYDGQRVLDNRRRRDSRDAFADANSLSSDEDEEDNNRNRFHRRDNNDEDDDDDDDSNYFTSATPSTPRKPRQHRITDRSGYISSTSPKHRLPIKNPSSLTDVLSQLWSTSGLTSMWKATNATFIYSLLLPTLNTFIRSLLSALLGLPDDGTTSSVAMDILTAASPSTTLILTLISSALSAVILAPIDTARTFLIATPLTHGPRSLLRAIRLLPTPRYRIPSHLVPITILHSSLPSLLSTGTPLFLKSYISIDPALNPSAWSLFTFLASGLEMGIRFPLETVLRRAQIATFTAPALRQKSRVVNTAEVPEVETIVPTARTYRGILGTMWGIVYEEGVSPSPSDMERAHHLVGKSASRAQQQQQQQKRRRQGQGIQGLYRGWRIGMWGLAGIWGADLCGTALGVGEDDFVTASSSGSGIRTGKARAF